MSDEKKYDAGERELDEVLKEAGYAEPDMELPRPLEKAADDLKSHRTGVVLDHPRGSVRLDHLESALYALLRVLRQGQNKAILGEDLNILNDLDVDGSINCDGSAVIDVNGSVGGNLAVTGAVTAGSCNLIDALSLLPPGVILPYGGTSLPDGYLWCDGSAKSRTTYAALFAAVGTNYGNGDGSTTFNVPEGRGYFLRGQDEGQGNDPDAGTRTALSGGNTGDAVGSYQAATMLNHTHTTTIGSHGHTTVMGSHGHTLRIEKGSPTSHTYYIYSQYQSASYDTNISQSVVATNLGTKSSSNYNHGNKTSGNPSAGGGNETRPINIYVRYIIKT